MEKGHGEMSRDFAAGSKSTRMVGFWDCMSGSERCSIYVWQPRSSRIYLPMDSSSFKRVTSSNVSGQRVGSFRQSLDDLWNNLSKDSRLFAEHRLVCDQLPCLWMFIIVRRTPKLWDTQAWLMRAFQGIRMCLVMPRALSRGSRMRRLWDVP